MIHIRKKFVLLTAILLSIVGYYLIYSIPNDETKLAQGIKNHFNRGRYEQFKVDSVEVEKSLEIDNIKATLILVDNYYIGQAVLKKGLNNKFRVVDAFYGSAISFAKVINVKDKNYLILLGKNISNLKYIKVNYENKSNRVPVPEGDYFMIYMSVPDYIVDIPIDFKYYDKNNEEIDNYRKYL